MTPLLEIDHLEKRFGGVHAVKGASFAVSAGETVGLIGPNGSGKTTVLNLISGAIKLTAGRVLFEGRQISGLAPHRIARQGVARTFQLVRTPPSLTAVENVIAPLAFGPARLWGEAARRAALEKLELVGLADRADQPAGALNYIDQKRIELARALAADPKVLLLDEWLAGLNPVELEAGVDLIRSVKSSGVTILFVEHVLDAVRALCDRCVVMNAGQVIADEPPEQALRDPKVIEAYLGDAHLEEEIDASHGGDRHA